MMKNGFQQLYEFLFLEDERILFEVMQKDGQTSVDCRGFCELVSGLAFSLRQEQAEMTAGKSRTRFLAVQIKNSPILYASVFAALQAGFDVLLVDPKLGEEPRKQLLQEALSQDVKDTYNMVSVDGDTSTNDTVLLLANGMAENPEINEKNEDYQKFCEALNYINTTLAKKIAGDGEGATALFEVRIIGAESKEQAVTLSKSIVTSSLTKAAIYGHDANWGRILCAMGYSGAQFDPEKVDLYFESKAGKIQIIENGVAVDYSEEEATKILSEDAVTAIADVKMGDCTATAWGCDLTYDYIKINADYRS